MLVVFFIYMMCNEVHAVAVVTQAFMSDALGVGAFLESADGQVVLLKRGEHLAEAPGLWDIPGGHPEPQVNDDHDDDAISILQLLAVMDQFHFPLDLLIASRNSW